MVNTPGPVPSGNGSAGRSSGAGSALGSSGAGSAFRSSGAGPAGRHLGAAVFTVAVLLVAAAAATLAVRSPGYAGSSVSASPRAVWVTNSAQFLLGPDQSPDR